MMWKPIALSGKHRKAMDRDRGADLIVPWPPGLPFPEPPMTEGEQRSPTSEQTRVALELLDPACAAARLAIIGMQVMMVRRPGGLPRPHAVEPHWVIHIVGRRWLRAGSASRPNFTWPEDWTPYNRAGVPHWYAGAIERA